MQFRGHSLPVHQSMIVSWAFTLSHFVSQICLRDFFRLLAIGMCHFLLVHHFGMAYLDGSKVTIQQKTCLASWRLQNGKRIRIICRWSLNASSHRWLANFLLASPLIKWTILCTAYTPKRSDCLYEFLSKLHHCSSQCLLNHQKHVGDFKWIVEESAKERTQKLLCETNLIHITVWIRPINSDWIDDNFVFLYVHIYFFPTVRIRYKVNV